MKIFCCAVFLSIIVCNHARANYLDRAIAKCVVQSAAYTITNYPIVISMIALIAFRHEVCRLLSDNPVTRLMGEYPKTSFIIGLIALEAAAMVITSS